MWPVTVGRVAAITYEARLCVEAKKPHWVLHVCGTDLQFKKSRLNDHAQVLQQNIFRFNTLFQPVEKCCRGEGEPKSGSDLPS